MKKHKQDKLIKTLAKLWKRIAWKELAYVDSEDFKPLPYIDRGGTELEGAHADMHDCGDGSWHGDCSVEVSGNCRDDDDYCECYDNCECEECERCTNCDDHIDDCECDSCHLCSECLQHTDDCVCAMHYSSCEVEGCTDNQVCTNCREQWADDNHYFDCREMSNFTWRCNQECYCECECSSGSHVDGEKVSQPMKTRLLMHYINNFYPEETNSTCGAHKHTSVINPVKNYSILMEQHFCEEFLMIGLYKWAECLGVKKDSAFYRRMDGDNSMCVPRYRVYDQFMAYDKPDDRYCAVNYCYANHKTIEVRVLPAFQDKRLTISASLAVEQIISTYLNSNQNTLQIHRGTN